MRIATLLIKAICLSRYAMAAVLSRVHKAKKAEGSYIVTLKDDMKLSQISQEHITEIINGEAKTIAAEARGELTYVYTNAIHGFAAKLSEDALNYVLKDPRVESVEEDGVVQLNSVGSWGLDRIDDMDLPLDNSYNPAFNNQGLGVTAYVIDTGILATHVEFEGRATQVYNSAGGSNEDCNGHGTHVAGTIGAKTYGVANKVNLVGVKVLNCSGSGTWSGVIAGIDWVRANAVKPATANMSLGGDYSLAVNNAVKNLVNSGVTTVVAAGNESKNACLYSPASEPNAITVAATTDTDARSSFSNWGSCVDIFAPGSSITAPWIGSNTATKTIDGTSMASPHVCGGVALHLGENQSLNPAEVSSILLKNSITNIITNVGIGSPNNFLYVGSQAPTISPVPTCTSSKSPSSTHSPTIAPTHSPTIAPTHRPTIALTYTPSASPSFEPTGSPSASPTLEPSKTPSASPTLKSTMSPSKSPSSPPSNEPTGAQDICEIKSQSECKYQGANCRWGEFKILGPCVPRRDRYKHNCSRHSPAECSHNSSHGGLCLLKNGVCTHLCDHYCGYSKCKHLYKFLNPCRGCHPKIKCNGICEGKTNMSQCNKVSDKCVWGQATNIECHPNREKNKHDCSQYSTTECYNQGGLCTMKDGICIHVCDSLSILSCRRSNVCKVNKYKNPCGGCHPKTTCP